MKSRLVVGTLAGSLVLVWTASAFAQADPAAGQVAFNQKCASCHTIEPGGKHSLLGPNLLGVIGRTAGTVAGWDFSPALRESQAVWTKESLNKWLADPEAFAPGSQMAMKVPDRFEREDIIAYIRSLQPAAEGSSGRGPAAEGQR